MLNGSYEDKLKMMILLIDYGVDLSKPSKPKFYLTSKDNNCNPKIIRLLEIFKIAPKKYDGLNEALEIVAKHSFF